MSMSFIKEVLIAIPIIIIVAIIASHLVVVPNDSMEPSMNQGDMFLIEKTEVLGLFNELNPENIESGDLILYTETNSSEGSEEGHGEEETTYMHKVFAVQETGGEKHIILKDDNNQSTEYNISMEQIKGRAVMWGGNYIIIPKVGWPIIWIKGTGH